MRTARCIVALVLVNVFTWGAKGCNGDADRTVAGRTRSLSRVVDVDSASTSIGGQLRLRRSNDQATGETQCRLEARLEGSDLQAAILRLPTGEEAVMAEREGTFLATIDGTLETIDARCPPGGYTFSARSGDGAVRSLTLQVTGAPPPAPSVVKPTDMAVVPTDALRIAWSWEGTAALFDVELIDVSSGRVAYHVADIAERTHRVPAGALLPGRRYRLEVTSASASASAPVRLEATSTIALDVVGS